MRVRERVRESETKFVQWRKKGTLRVSGAETRTLENESRCDIIVSKKRLPRSGHLYAFISRLREDELSIISVT